MSEEKDIYFTEDAVENEVFIGIDNTLEEEYQTIQDSTQYFSILESNETGKLHTSIVPSSKPCATEIAQTLDDQVVLYRVGESEDLYAVQVADDGSGKFQRYQYRVRQNEDGQLEALTDTIQLQQSDTVVSETEQNDAEEEDDGENYGATYLEEREEVLQFHIGETEEEEAPVEAEILEEHHLEEELEAEPEFEQEAEPEPEVEPELEQELEPELEPEIEPEIESEHTNDLVKIKTEFLNISENEIDEFENDVFNNEMHSTPKPLVINKTFSNDRVSVMYKDGKKLQYFVLGALEKENQSTDQVRELYRPNPRSVLKTNVIKEEPKAYCKKTISIPMLIKRNEPAAFKKVTPVEDIVPKHRRLPRKQTITPVEREDSEITVIPFKYSIPIPGVFLTSSQKKAQHSSEVLELEDSDDSDPTFTLSGSKRTRKHRKRSKVVQKPIEITSTDESDSDVRLVEDDGEDKNQEQGANVNEVPESNDDKNAQHNDDKLDSGSNDSSSKEFKCTKCPQVFSKSHSLKLHMHAHKRRESKQKRSLSTSLRRSNREESEKPDDSTLKCEECSKTFSSTILLKAHKKFHRKQKDMPILEKTSIPQRRSLRPSSVKALRRTSNAMPLLQLNSAKTPPKTTSFKAPLRPSSAKVSLRLSTAKAALRSSIGKVTRQSTIGKGPSRPSIGSTLLRSNTVKSPLRQSIAFSCKTCKITCPTRSLLDEHVRKNCIANKKTSSNQTSTTRKMSPNQRLERLKRNINGRGIPITPNIRTAAQRVVDAFSK